jgi:hypothetical protein
MLFREQYRNAANFISADLCALDIDNDKPELPIVSIADIKKEFADCKMIIGTSRSHQKPKNGKPPQDRFRVILQFERRVTNRGEYEASMRGLMGMFDFLDKACVDAARLFFPCKKIIYAEGSGETIPVARYDEIKEHPAQIKFEEIKKRSKGVSKNVLDFLDHGKVFAGGRNNSIYHSAGDLLKVGLTLNQTIAFISEAPFDRSYDWNDREIYTTCFGVYKRAGLV